jgi:hypothetical protein
MAECSEETTPNLWNLIRSVERSKSRSKIQYIAQRYPDLQKPIDPSSRFRVLGISEGFVAHGVKRTSHMDGGTDVALMTLFADRNAGQVDLTVRELQNDRTYVGLTHSNLQRRSFVFS